mgnify:CR=1 FL=1
MSEEKSASWFTFADNLPAGLSARRCRIEVAHGPDAGISKEFSSTRIRVGAGKACDFVLTDRRVSRSHIEISLTLDGYRLKDLESTNGTHVGDHRIRDIYVSSGNIIQLGRTKIEFTELPIMNPELLIGITIGISLPYIFSGLSFFSLCGLP